MKKWMIFSFTTVFVFSNLIPGAVFAASLRLVNVSSEPVRIQTLGNQCDGYYVNYQKEVVLAPGEEFSLKETTAVVHTYAICSGAYCSSAAMGMKGDLDYVLELYLEDGWLIGAIPIPDHWVGSNIDCP